MLSLDVCVGVSLTMNSKYNSVDMYSSTFNPYTVKMSGSLEELSIFCDQDTMTVFRMVYSTEMATGENREQTLPPTISSTIGS